MRILTVMLCLVVSASAWGKLILISDVDDTIKDSKVRDTWEMIHRATVTDETYLIKNMSSLYQFLADKGGVENFYYVSKIPRPLEELHREFLIHNKFPNGKIYSRGLEGDFKFRTINKIIKNSKATKVILIGDNGQSDPIYYMRIRKYQETRGVRVKSFIRKAYSKNYRFYKGQKLFTDGEDLYQKLISP